MTADTSSGGPPRIDSTDPSLLSRLYVLFTEKLQSPRNPLFTRLGAKKADIDALLDELPENDTLSEAIAEHVALGRFAINDRDINSYMRQLKRLNEYEARIRYLLLREDAVHGPDQPELRIEARLLHSEACAVLPEPLLNIVEHVLIDEQGTFRSDIDQEDVIYVQLLIDNHQVETEVDAYIQRSSKITLRTQIAYFISTTFITICAILLILTFNPQLISTGYPPQGPVFISTVVIFGVLGASVSGMLRLSETLKSNKSPRVSTYWLVIGRSASGAAGAFILYVFTIAGYVGLVFQINEMTPAVIFSISFLAGFSERIFLRAVETLSGETRVQASERQHR